MVDVALISVITSGALGAGGIIFGAMNSRSERQARLEERKFDRETAREERVGERRAEVYVDLLVNLERDLFVYEAIRPDALRPAGPAPLNDEEWIRWKSCIAAFGSPEVIDLFRKHGDVGSRLATAWVACEMLDGAGQRPSPAFGEQFGIIEEGREEMRRRTLPALEDRIREELTA